MPMSELQVAKALARTRAVLYVDPHVDPPTTYSAQLRTGNWATLGIQTVTRTLSRFRHLVPPGSLRHPFHSIAVAISRRQIRRQVSQSGVASGRSHHCERPASIDPHVGERRVVYATNDLVAGASLVGVPRSVCVSIDNCRRRYVTSL